jgi:hypothetical protein
MRETYVDGAYRPYKAAVAADLLGKEGYVVEQVAATETIQLYTNGIPLGVLHSRLEGQDVWSVRLFGKGGTVKCVAGGAINSPAYVKPANGGKVVAAAQGNLAVGFKTSPVAAAADGDVIEVVDNFITMP